MPFISGIFPAAASKTLQACAASPGLNVDPDSQNHAVDGALQTLCGVKKAVAFPDSDSSSAEICRRGLDLQ